VESLKFIHVDRPELEIVVNAATLDHSVA
jgi:hypothetical protein